MPERMTNFVLVLRQGLMDRFTMCKVSGGVICLQELVLFTCRRKKHVQ